MFFGTILSDWEVHYNPILYYYKEKLFKIIIDQSIILINSENHLFLNIYLFSALVPTSLLKKTTIDGASRSVPWQNLGGFFQSWEMGLNLKELVARLNTFAPLSLAASWDNVGLLIEPSGFFKRFFTVLRIYDILVWIRIRIRGSMPLTNGSGSYFRHWPSRFQQTNLLNTFFLLITFWRYNYIIFQR